MELIFVHFWHSCFCPAKQCFSALKSLSTSLKVPSKQCFSVLKSLSRSLKVSAKQCFLALKPLSKTPWVKQCLSARKSFNETVLLSAKIVQWCSQRCLCLVDPVGQCCLKWQDVRKRIYLQRKNGKYKMIPQSGRYGKFPSFFNRKLNW